MTYTHSQDSIIDDIGAEDWYTVVENFENKTFNDIVIILDDMFPLADNIGLAQSIYDELN